MRFRLRRGDRARDDAAAGGEPAGGTPPSAADRRAASDDSPITADRALDLVADLLRTYGEYAFDVGHHPAAEIEEHFETWARHLLVGVPRPARLRTGPAPDAEPAAPDPASGGRDLTGLQLAFREERKLEHRYVTTALDQFREAAWAFIGSLRRSLAVEQTADRRVGHRMRRLETAVRSGEAARIKEEAIETVSVLADFLTQRGKRQQAAIEEMAARLESLRDELDSVRAQAAIDGLTEVYNRLAFDEQIEREIDLATLFGQHPCLVMIDIDHFKWINDQHGHPCGDAVLRAIAATLSRCFMRRDDFLARYGGEEFAVVLRDIDVDTARGLADRAMDAIRNLEVPHPGLDEPIRLTASMGLAQLRRGENAGSWVDRADRALYQAKDAGRDRVMLDPIDAEGAAAAGGGPAAPQES